MATTPVTFTVTMPLNRADALDRRDEIITALALLGIRVSLIDCGTDVRMVDRGLPTIGEATTSLANDLVRTLSAAGLMDDRDDAFTALRKVADALGMFSKTWAAGSIGEVGDLLAAEIIRRDNERPVS